MEPEIMNAPRPPHTQVTFDLKEGAFPNPELYFDILRAAKKAVTGDRLIGEHPFGMWSADFLFRNFDNDEVRVFQLSPKSSNSKNHIKIEYWKQTNQLSIHVTDYEQAIS